MKKEITELLGNHEVQPSARCWDAISQQLSAMQSSTQSQPDTSVSQQASSSIKEIFLQKSGAFWAKTAAIVTTSVTATTIAVLAIINAVQPDATPQPAMETLPIVVVQEDTLKEEISEDTLEIAVQEKATEPAATRTTTPVVSHDAPSIISPTSIPSTVVSAPIVSQPISNHSVTITTPVTTTGNVTTPQAVTPKKEPVSTPAQTVAQSKKDPVIEQFTDDAIDHTPTVAIEIPNVFTPNGDGINEYFIIGGIEHCAKAELIIRNVNKSVVFHTKHYENNWNADHLDNGMYYYTFSYVINGIPQIRQGVVSVLR
ncbi:MAG: gliding motility-associated C-terminal domain-containing protein [Bacteroidales bacterium]|jgi:gliding motility-associated-like protein|nr:gliding motility-associated C-terminal domain-containing protein [Bacteroidales bacterium]